MAQAMYAVLNVANTALAGDWQVEPAVCVEFEALPCVGMVSVPGSLMSKL